MWNYNPNWILPVLLYHIKFFGKIFPFLVSILVVKSLTFKKINFYLLQGELLNVKLTPFSKW